MLHLATIELDPQWDYLPKLDQALLRVQSQVAGGLMSQENSRLWVDTCSRRLELDLLHRMDSVWKVRLTSSSFSIREDKVINKQKLEKFHRARWILIIATAVFFVIYILGVIFIDNPIWSAIMMVIYIPWLFYWVFKKYRCPRCGAIPLLQPFKAIDLAPRVCSHCGFNFEQKIKCEKTRKE